MYKPMLIPRQNERLRNGLNYEKVDAIESVVGENGEAIVILIKNEYQHQLWHDGLGKFV